MPSIAIVLGWGMVTDGIAPQTTQLLVSHQLLSLLTRGRVQDDAKAKRLQAWLARIPPPHGLYSYGRHSLLFHLAVSIM
jgi:hypothetical protein